MDQRAGTWRTGEGEDIDALVELSLDLRWSWNHATDEIWGALEPELWARAQNPWVILQTVSHRKLQAAVADPEFRRRVAALLQRQREMEQGVGWFQTAWPNAPLSLVAYFSMEYMLSEALPIYSGGLGHVAGDQLKSASDLGVPVVAVGLLYQQGYFRQEIDANGAQLALFPYNDPGQLPIVPLRDANGEWLRLTLALPGFTLRIRTWQVKVGRTMLYLLDTNDPANPPALRGITSELYGGGPELRLRQEMILGIGGWRLLRAIGLQPDVCHLNEGHAALVVLERARDFMAQAAQPFDVALAVTRAGNLFTTHTPVDAGFDRFTPELMDQYLGRYAEAQLGISFDDLLALGRQDRAGRSELFNMAYLAVHGSRAVNGVSRLHGSVSRRIFRGLFPQWPEHEIPVGHVTNGVHVPTWDSAAADAVWTEACGKQRWLGSLDSVAQEIGCVTDADLWRLRTDSRHALVAYARARLALQLEGRGASAEAVADADRLLDPDALTLGFARRFAGYKRPNLLLQDRERLIRILNDPQRPVQLLLAGKAHPQDAAGQALIQAWTDFLRRPEVRRHVIFLSDYDMLLTQRLVQGVDVWINTPRRPWEACGTSGMKVLVNGGLNLSELDGWWAEAYTPEVGWAIGDGREHGEDPAWDAADADALYRILEQEVVPGFYTRDARGIPTDWIARIRHSMSRLTPQYSANRTVRQYTEEHYLPAAEAYRARSADGGRQGVALVDWQRTIAAGWTAVRFGTLRTETRESRHSFEVEVFPGGLDPEGLRVELYAEPAAGDGPVHAALARSVEQGRTATASLLYRGDVPATRPAADYTLRIVPYRPGVAVPLEAAQILWQH